MTVDQKGKSLKEVQDIISKAITKVKGTKENDLCKYLPMDSGGYMHHFTLRKMKHKDPSQLGTLIEKFIIKADRPRAVAPKRRAPRGSRKRRDNLAFSRTQLERMLQIARLAGDKEMISVLSPRKSLPAVKRELISSIRHNRVEQELWNSYLDCINAGELATSDK
ncbi:MAG: hypothetical protein P0S96_06360 [Simkaniaceae bacterium]|nr:hypothetical protein [Candidatus Sacchlamyda saccharinae]